METIEELIDLITLEKIGENISSENISSEKLYSETIPSETHIK